MDGLLHGLADMVRLSELSALRPLPTLDGLEGRRHAEASQGLFACWKELSATLDQADAAALERYQERLLAAQTPLLRLLAAGTDFSDARVGSDKEYQVRVLGSLRAAFDFLDDGATARQELITIFGEVLEPVDSVAERAIRKVANKLSLVASMAGMLRTALLVVGVALALFGGMTVALLWLLR